MPKAVSGLLRKCPILNYLRFKQMARTCCNLWSLVEPGGSRQLQFYLQSVSTNGSIWAFISEPRATVIFQQRVFSWSQGDSSTGPGRSHFPEGRFGPMSESPTTRSALLMAIG